MTEIKPIPTDVQKLILDGLDGEFRMPTSAAGVQLFEANIRAAVDTLVNSADPDVTGNELRSLAPAYGYGSALDLLTPQDMAEMIAEFHAWSYEGEIVELATSKDTPPFVTEMRELMMSVHDDIYSEVGHCFDTGGLIVDDGLVRIVDDPDDAPA